MRVADHDTSAAQASPGVPAPHGDVPDAEQYKGGMSPPVACCMMLPPASLENECASAAVFPEPLSHSTQEVNRQVNHVQLKPQRRHGARGTPA